MACVALFPGVEDCEIIRVECHLMWMIDGVDVARISFRGGIEKCVGKSYDDDSIDFPLRTQ